MSPDRPPLADLPRRLRDNLADARANVRQWRDDVQKDPTLLWRTTGVRIILWVVLSVIVFVVIRALLGALTPAGAGDFTEATQHATLYVACTNDDCRETYVTKQPMDFDRWPLVCRKCRRPTVYRATVCPRCRQWYATIPGSSGACPWCAAKAVPEQPIKRAKSRPVDPNDAEDDW